uniref:hypothetical protein n=1 Tax=Paenibacillus sp. 1-18 TaxID=1333846 RepID=UPI001E5E615D
RELVSKLRGLIRIVVGIFLIKGATIVYADNGRGIYFDAFWAADPAGQAVNFVTAKVYGA